MQSLPKIGFTGYGAYLPPREVTNDDLCEMVDTSDEWIRRRTGIARAGSSPRTSPSSTWPSCGRARALEDAGVDPSELGDIHVGVNTWLRFPSLATQVQEALGAHDASAVGRVGRLLGLHLRRRGGLQQVLVEKIRYGRDVVALVIGVDGFSHVTDWTDRSTCVLLGDGAGAVVLRQGVEQGGILATHTHADGQYGSMLYLDSRSRAPSTRVPEQAGHAQQCTRPYLRMDGRKVYGVAVQTMVNDIRRVIEKYNRSIGRDVRVEDIDHIYPHQANLRIIEMVAKKLHIPLEKVYTDGIVKYGNTSAASIPIGYSDTRERYNGDGGSHLEIDVAFGSGFASGAILRRVA